MASSAWDRFVRSLSPRQPPSAQLELARAIQPVAPIAFGTEFLSEPLAEAAYGVGGADSNSAGAAPVGQAGYVALRPGSATFTGISRPRAAWVWFYPQAPVANPSATWTFVIWPSAQTDVVNTAVDPAAYAISMGPEPLSRFVQAGNFTAAAFSPLPSQGFSFAGVPGANFADRVEMGPFFVKPDNDIGVFANVAQDEVGAIFRWIEIPSL